jgi:hypothetical protein
MSDFNGSRAEQTGDGRANVYVYDDGEIERKVKKER